MDKQGLIKQTKVRMDGSLAALDNHLKGLRVGRASANFLDPVRVEIYGDKMPINQVAAISTPDAKTIAVQVWDRSTIKYVEKAINDANLGLMALADGDTIRINVPPLSQERRKEMVKLAGKYCEDAKVAVRNIRRDVLDDIKKAEKDSAISKDEMHSLTDEVQKITDDFTKKMDEALKAREKEIMSI